MALKQNFVKNCPIYLTLMVTYVIISTTVKKLCALFLEKLKDDLHTDSKYSTDIRQAIEEICFISNISFKKPSTMNAAPFSNIMQNFILIQNTEKRE